MNRRHFVKIVAAAVGSLPFLGQGKARAARALLAPVYSLLLDDSVSQYFRSQFGLTLDSIYWGDLHNHTTYSSDSSNCEEGCNTPAQALEYARDTAGLDFVALTDHADMHSSSSEGYVDTQWRDYINDIIPQYNDEASFIIFPGWEYTNTYGLEPAGGSDTGYGHKQVIFRDIAPDSLPKKRIGAFAAATDHTIDVAQTAEDLWNSLGGYEPSQAGDGNQAITIIHTPAMKGDKALHNHQTDFDVMHGDFVRNVEIYSKWGSSEGEAPAGLCSTQDDVMDFDSNLQVAEKTLRSLLHTRWVDGGDTDFHLSFVGGTDNHVGKPGNSDAPQCCDSNGQNCSFPYRGSVTGLAVTAFNRQNLWQALLDRHSIASTTDRRIPLLVAVETGGNHYLMGEMGTHDGAARLRICADSGVSSLDVIVDGCLYATLSGNSGTLDLDLSSGRHYVYVRAVIVSNGVTQMSWSSPVYLKQA